MTIGERIKKARKYAQKTQKQLADAVKISVQAISQLESGDTKQPKPTTLFSIAKSCNVNAEWIATGDGEMVGSYVNSLSGSFHISKQDRISEAKTAQYGHESATKLRRVPVFTKEEIANHTRKSIIEKDHQTWATTDSQMSADAFAVVMEGSTMLHPGSDKSIPPGATLFIEPDEKPLNGDIVVVKDADKNILIKKLEIDGPNTYLTSINPAYGPIILMPEHQIVGVALDVKYKLR